MQLTRTNNLLIFFTLNRRIYEIYKRRIIIILHITLYLYILFYC